MEEELNLLSSKLHKIGVTIKINYYGVNEELEATKPWRNKVGLLANGKFMIIYKFFLCICKHYA